MNTLARRVERLEAIVRQPMPEMTEADQRCWEATHWLCEAARGQYPTLVEAFVAANARGESMDAQAKLFVDIGEAMGDDAWAEFEARAEGKYREPEPGIPPSSI